jgi:L-rhamnose-H+ transport protein
MVSYSKATEILGSLGPIIAWPLFMIFIILVSNFWGVKHGEWQHASRGAKRKMFFSVGLLILAIIVLVIATFYQ